MPDDLTPTQSRVLDYIATHIVERQRPPTRIGIAQHFGWASGNAAEEHMRALVAASNEARAAGKGWAGGTMHHMQKPLIPKASA